MVQPLSKTVTNILLPHNPAIVFLGVYPNDLKIYVHTKTCTKIFIAAFLIIAKTWKQPRCCSVDEKIKSMVHPDNGILFSTKKK